MIKDFLIINCTGKNDKIGLKINNNFFIHDFQTKIKNNEILVSTILNLTNKHKANIDENFSILVNNGPGSFSTIRVALSIAKGDYIIRIDGHAEISDDFIKNSLDCFNTIDSHCVGGPIKHIANGLIGKVIRRGTNYLICFKENNIMFKSWIKDLKEAREKEVKPAAQTGVYGVPAKDREVGTAAHRKYAQSMVPGQGKIKNFNIEDFINKYKAKK